MRSPLSATRAFIGRALIALLVCAAVVALAVLGTNRYIDDEVARIPRIALTTALASGKGTNFLIIGSDTRSFVKSQADRKAFTDASTTPNDPARSDTMMVLHADGPRSFGVSFPRDLWVTIPGRGNMKLNAAFNDGPQKLIDTLQTNFGVDISHYLEVDFATFRDIVDAAGAVPVYFPYPARDLYSGLDNVWVAGCYHLNGGASLAYVRARHLEYYIDGRWQSADPLSDLDRIQRQQDFVTKLGKNAVRKALDDPSIAPGLADKVIPKLRADKGFDRPAFNSLVNAFVHLADRGGDALSFSTFPWEGPARRAGQDVLLVKKPEADTVAAALRGEAPPPASTSTPTTTVPASATTAPPPLHRTDVRVRVLNGTGTQGAAGNASTELTNLGFPAGGVGNDPRGTVPHSEVRYRPGDEAKARLVAEFVPGAVLVADATLSGTDVVVVIGKGFSGVGASVPSTAPPATGASAGSATPTTAPPSAATCR